MFCVGCKHVGMEYSGGQQSDQEWAYSEKQFVIEIALKISQGLRTLKIIKYGGIPPTFFDPCTSTISAVY